ncbi:MAG: hypothetical protein NZ869_05890 [Thermoanaerobaculum sp.]|nr:hypothetical protein [Thermoanaerobaculum sp.]MDW7967658.1 hypothetical protein [Thermoanaerobaculum sp.]
MKAILVNPWAGGGRCQRVMARLLPRLAGWLAAPVLVPQTPGEMRHQTCQLVQEGYQRLVVAGGDVFEKSPASP